MPHYILLINWTDQGRKEIKKSHERYDSFKLLVEKSGGKVVSGYYTLGAYDVVLVIEAPSDEVVMSTMLKTCSYGNVRSRTLKAFPAEEGFKIINDL